MNGLRNVSAITMSSGIFEKSNNALALSSEKQKEVLKLKQATRDFESLFLSYLLDKMSDGGFKSDILGDDSSTQQIYQSMYHQELAKNMAQAGGIGLAKLLYAQLSKAL